MLDSHELMRFQARFPRAVEISGSIPTRKDARRSEEGSPRKEARGEGRKDVKTEEGSTRRSDVFAARTKTSINFPWEFRRLLCVTVPARRAGPKILRNEYR
eukprot:gene10835-biopygen4811